MNCVDFYDSDNQLFYLSYINDNNCDDGEENEFDLSCDAFLNDGLDCIVDLAVDDNLEIPKTFNLGKNFPNPFNPSTTIPFSIPKISNVNLIIYNILGQQIHKKSFNGLLPGNYQYSWDGANFNSGIYIYAIETNTGVYLREKMLLVK